MLRAIVIVYFLPESSDLVSIMSDSSASHGANTQDGLVDLGPVVSFHIMLNECGASG